MANETPTSKLSLLQTLAALPLKVKAAAGAGVVAVGAAAVAGVIALSGSLGGGVQSSAPDAETQMLSAFWPTAFNAEVYDEPAFEDDAKRTNNAFNVQDFGEQGNNGWFYRYGKSKAPWKSKQIEGFDGEKYYQSGANGLEIKKNFLHTSEAASPMLEWRAAEDGSINITVTYVKNVNGDKNPSYPDGVQLQVYKSEELLALENVDISVTEENLAQIKLEDVEVTELESLYFVVDPRTNNAFDGGSLYIAINDVNAAGPTVTGGGARKDNNAHNQTDFGEQGQNGWCYEFGNTPEECALVSNSAEGEYTNSTSPNLSISQGFIHPAINDNAVLTWTPAVNGTVDLRVKYTKFEQHDGNPDFPDGVKVKVYKNDQLLYEQHVDAPAEGENKIRFREGALSVKSTDKLYFMVDSENNSSYDGGAFDITVIDVNGKGTEKNVKVDETSEIRQNFADVKYDFGPQGSNGWIFQSGYEDEPFGAYNTNSFSQKDDRYFEDNYLEIKRDYVNPGEHGRSPVIKWKVAQNGKIKIKASYTKMKNEDANPAWPDGTRVSIYHNGTLLTQQYFAPEVSKEVTKRLDVSSVKVKKGDYITMVINGLENNAYDGGKYEFSISSLTGLVGASEKNVKPFYDGERVNFASTLDDFGKQGYNGWYYQYGYNNDPFCAINVAKNDKNADTKLPEKYFTLDGVEIKRDYIVPSTNGKNSNVKWVVAKNGKINIDLEYTKLKNEDANPAWPDGTTVYLMKNKTVLKKVHFAPLTKKEVTKSLAVNNVSVKKGDCITMVVDPGENGAYDGGKYMFVIEDSSKVPTIKAGNYDNSTSLSELESMKQGTDGWWFLEGKTPAKAKVLTKMKDDKSGYTSRRTEGLEMTKSFVHTGDTRDPIYLWVVGKDGKIDVAGEYVKFGHEDANPDWPDGVTVKIWKNNTQLSSSKVKVKRGDGNNNTYSFAFDKLSVKRGDRIAFQICADKNWAWDGGALSVAIDPSSNTVRTPGDDNNTSLGGLTSLEQGTDGWWFLEGKNPANAKELTKMNEDRTAYFSRKTEAMEVKKDYVHPGATQDPIYQWIVAKNGKVDLTGSYVKFGQNDANPDYPDGVTLKIWLNDTILISRKVKALKGDGNNNVAAFNYDKLAVKKGDRLSFQICSDKNYAWDAGQLSVAIEESTTLKLTPGNDNNSVLANISNVEQGNDGWWFMEGTSISNAKPLTNLNSDKSAYTSVKDSGLEVKKDYVHPGTTQNPIYKWVAAEDGKLDVKGSYVKFAHDDGNPDWPDGITLSIYQNDTRLYQKNVKALKGSDNTAEFSFYQLNVKKGDIFSFQINPNGNNAWDAGRLSVIFGDETLAPPVEPDHETDEDYVPDPERTNNADLKADFGEQGSNGWFYGSCDWNSTDFVKLSYDAKNNRYYNNGKPELKADFVEPGAGRNAGYKWIAAQDGTIKVSGEYTKFANADDASADGTCVRIFVNGVEKKWMGTIGNFGADQTVTFDETYTVKAGDAVIFAVSPEGNDSYDGGRLAVTIAEAQGEDAPEEEIPEVTPDPNRTNSADLQADFGMQGTNGWYYGTCEWDSKNFTKLAYDADNHRYFNNGKPELKADFVEPGAGKNAAYKWVVAKDGTVTVDLEYVKYANSDDANADGTCVRVFLNGKEEQWLGTLGNSGEDRSVSFAKEFTVKAGDEFVFAVNPEGNDSWDGGRLSVTISEKKAEEEQQPEQKPDEKPEEKPEQKPEEIPEVKPDPKRTNDTELKKDFSGEQGKNGWFYGMCEWDGKDFTKLAYDEKEKRYYNDGKPELKADFVEPGAGKNAAYKWVVAEDGTITVDLEYVKFANAADAEANGTCVRVFLNGKEQEYLGATGNFSDEKTVTFNREFTVKAGDEFIFAVNPEGNDSYDGGRLSITISEKKEETKPEAETEAKTEEPAEAKAEENAAEAAEKSSEEPAAEEAKETKSEEAPEQESENAAEAKAEESTES